MKMIDDMETVCQLLKEKEILYIRDGAQAHYVLDLQTFAEMFADAQFAVWERSRIEEISEEKDAEYYGWTHK